MVMYDRVKTGENPDGVSILCQNKVAATDVISCSSDHVQGRNSERHWHKGLGCYHWDLNIEIKFEYVKHARENILLIKRLRKLWNEDTPIKTSHYQILGLGEGFGGILPTQIGEEQNIPFMVKVFYFIKYR